MSKSWKTKLIHSDARVPEGFRSLSIPVYRGSTVLFPKVASATDNWNQYEVGYTYGVYGTPTVLELAARVCELEHGYRTIIAPGGQAAISLLNLALLSAGDHVLLPENLYGPHAWFTRNILGKFGVEATFYPPAIGRDIPSLFRPKTKLVWCETPGSVTMEVPDVPAIAAAAHEAGALVALDNTWAAGIYFDAFAHGVDITLQALTKYVGGHSDLLLGSVTTRDAEPFERLGAAQQLLGCAVSPDDCSLALRGMKTMAVRLKTVQESALHVAHWLSQQPQVERVLHPALPSCPGHELWKRDFTGSSSVFSFVFQRRYTKPQVQAFVDALELFKIGYSWGGVTSLVMAYDLTGNSSRPDYGPRVVRLNVGLEDVDDLTADLTQALKALTAERIPVVEI